MWIFHKVIHEDRSDFKHDYFPVHLSSSNASLVVSIFAPSLRSTFTPRSAVARRRSRISIISRLNKDEGVDSWNKNKRRKKKRGKRRYITICMVRDEARHLHRGSLRRRFQPSSSPSSYLSRRYRQVNKNGWGSENVQTVRPVWENLHRRFRSGGRQTLSGLKNSQKNQHRGELVDRTKLHSSLSEAF